MSMQNQTGSGHDPPREQNDPLTTECPHVVLAAHWDSVADIGHEDRAIGYKCSSCGATLTVEEGLETRRRHIAPVT